MDTVLLLSIFLVFLTALIGSFIQRRKRDRVLADLHGFHTTVKLKSGKLIWGRMRVFPNGLELVYSQLRNPEVGMVTEGRGDSSFILFRDDMDDIEALYRYHVELSPANRERRLKEVARSTDPGPRHRAARHLWNFLNTFRDAINESLGMFLTRMKGTATSILFRTQDTQLKRIGAQTLGAVGNAYDPILERYVNRRVVIELSSELDGKVEYRGILKEYSPSWLSVLGCRIDQEHRLPLADVERLRLQRDLDFTLYLARSDSTLNGVVFTVGIRNRSTRPVHILKVESGDYRVNLDMTVTPEDYYEFSLTDLPTETLEGVDLSRLPCRLELIAQEHLPAPSRNPAPKTPSVPGSIPNLHLVCKSARETDVYIPRTLGVLRHGGEFIDSRK